MQEKQAAKLNKGDVTLKDARDLYRKEIGSSRRASILAAVIQYITR
jgi:hypothetical protein